MSGLTIFEGGISILFVIRNLCLPQKNESENHVEIAKLSDEDQLVLGIVIYDESKKVNKALDGLKFHD